MSPPGCCQRLPFVILYLLLSLDLQGSSHRMRLGWRRCWWKHITNHPGNSSSHKLRQFEPLLNTKQVKSINYTSHLSFFKKKKVKSDHRSKFSNLSKWKEEAWKISGLQLDSNPWPPRYWGDVWPTELWSHTLGARSICWVHIFPCSEMEFTFIYNCNTK